MPSRLIREEMLDSERLQTLPVDARWLYVSVLLTADDIGLFEVAPFKLARRSGLNQQAIPSLIQMLADADLVRVYEVLGKRFAFIPRYRQRLQIKRARHPIPPLALMADDEDAVSKINNLASIPPLDNSESRKKTVVHPSEPEPEPEPEEEIKDIVAAPLVIGETPTTSPKVPNCPFEAIKSAYHEHCPSLRKVVVFTNMRMKHCRARWVEVCVAEKFTGDEGLQWFVDYFKIAEQSDFLTGRTGNKKRPWRANFEWLMMPGNFAKVLEGNYSRETA